MTKDFLLKVTRIQEIHLFFSDKGFSKVNIHEKIIYPHWFISRMTYYNYLNMNAKKLLKDEHGLDWRHELSKYEPVDYMALMEHYRKNDPFSHQLYLDLSRQQKKDDSFE